MSSSLLKIAGILSPPQPTLSPQVFNPLGKLHTHVRVELIKRLSSKVPLDQVKGMYIMGSITGYKYVPETDIDVNVNVCNTFFSPEVQGHRLTGSINDKPLSNGTHPVDYFISE